MKSTKLLLIVIILFFAGSSTAQVGIGIATPNANSILDLTSTNKGLLIPRIALTATNAAAPVTTPATSLLIYNTATAATGTANAVTPGYYYWGGSSWVRQTDNGWVSAASAGVTNPVTATSFLGTSTNNHLDLVTNGLVRGRLSNLGEFFIGATNTSIPGDLMNSTGNSTFPFAVNGYTAFNGAGVYGSVTSGTTTYAGVQGEYYGTGGFNTAGVKGINGNTVAGTGFRVLPATGPRVGIFGNTSDGAGAYTFGLHGTFASTAIRCGAVFGDDFGIASGSLGYFASTGVDYAVYGFGQAHQNGTAGGFAPTGNNGIRSLDTNTFIGLGIYGGVMGGWVRGLKYGFTAKGETYGMYIDGKGYTNQPFAYLMPTATGERVASYMVTSMQAEVNSKGRVVLQSGKVYVPFDDNFKRVISGKPEDMMITATPQGNSGGVYVDNITPDGFWIVENNNGKTTVPVVWMATSAVKAPKPEIAPELLDKDFDVKMDKVMFNDNNTTEVGQAIWWDGTRVRWDSKPARQKAINAAGNARLQFNR